MTNRNSRGGEWDRQRRSTAAGTRWLLGDGKQVVQWVLLGAVLFLALRNVVLLSTWTMDDAYISFRYSRNLANGFGLVHNIGQPVKGYSNTLWTCLMSAPEYLGANTLLFSKLIGGLSLVLLILLTFRYGCWSFGPDAGLFRDSGTAPLRRRAARQHRRRSRAEATDPASADQAGQDSIPPKANARPGDRALLLPLLPGILIATSAPIVVWSMSGMEFGLYTCLILAAVLRRLNEQGDSTRRPLSALLFCLVVWSRPEGIAFFVAMAVHDGCVCALRKRIRRQDFIWYILPAAAYLGELAISSVYYGDPFPNTYYAKLRPSDASLASLLGLNLDRVVAPFHGDGYLTRNIVAFGGKGILLLGLLAICRLGRIRHVTAFLLMICAQVAFVCRIGHDWMTTARFIVPFLPFSFLLISESLHVLTHRLRRPWRATMLLATSVTVVWLVAPRNFRELERVRRKQPVSGARHLEVGKSLATLAEPGHSLSCFDIGGVGYATAYDIIDTAGLTNRFIARCNQGNSQHRTIVQTKYLLARQPDLIRWHPRQQPDQALRAIGLHLGRYLDFEDPKRRILVRRDLVLRDHVPDHAARLEPSPTERKHPKLVAILLPEACRPGSEIWGNLFWAREDNSIEWFERQIELRNSIGQSIPIRSTCIADHLGKNLDWHPTEYLSDTFHLEAPTQSGVYDLYVAASPNDSPQAVASIVVVDTMDVELKAQGLLRQAQENERQGQLWSAMAQAEAAAQLTRAPKERDRYVSLVVKMSSVLRSSLDVANPSESMSAINRAKYLLNRAAYLASDAPAELHNELRRLYGARRRLLEHLTPTWEAEAIRVTQERGQ